MQISSFLYRIILSSVACVTLPYFSTLSHRGRIFLRGGGEFIEHKVCALMFSTIFVANISHSEKNSAKYYLYIGLHVKYLLLLSHFNETNFLNRFLKNHQISYFLKIYPVGAELFQAGRSTNIMKQIVVFCSFVNSPKISNFTF
jgi:hypothetical protein